MQDPFPVRSRTDSTVTDIDPLEPESITINGADVRIVVREGSSGVIEIEERDKVPSEDMNNGDSIVEL